MIKKTEVKKAFLGSQCFQNNAFQKRSRRYIFFSNLAEVKTTVKTICKLEDFNRLLLIPNLYISCHRSPVAMEAAMSTKHSLKSSLIGMNVYSFVSRQNRFEMLIATFRLQYCQSSSGDEVDCLRVAIYARWFDVIGVFFRTCTTTMEYQTQRDET